MKDFAVSATRTIKSCRLSVIMPDLFAGLVYLFAPLFLFVAAINPAHADWRADLGAFRIGIVSEADPRADVAKREPFRLALEDALGLDVEIIPFKDFPTLISAQAAGRIEYSILSAAAYATGWVNCECLEPLATVTNKDGSSGFFAIVVTRLGGPTSIDNLTGKSVIAIAGNSLGGFDFAKFQMTEQGTNLEKSVVRLDTPASARMAISEFVGGKYDALVGWSTLKGNAAEGYTSGTLRDLVNASQGGTEGYNVIWKSSEIPFTTHAIRKNVNTEAKAILRNLLAGLYDEDPVAYDSIEPLHGGGFVEAKQVEFLPLIQFIKSLDSRQTPSPAKEPSGTDKPAKINDQGG